MIETLEQQLKQAVLNKDWETAEKISDLLDKQTERTVKLRTTEAQIIGSKKELTTSQITAIAAAIVSLGTFLATLF